MGDERRRNYLHNRLKTFLATVNAHSTTPLSLITAKETMTRVEEIFAEFQVVQAAQEKTAADDDAYAVQTAAGEAVEDTFSDVRGKLRIILEVLSAAFASRTAQATSQSAPAPRIKLPELTLPKFEGQIEEWMSFKDLFTAAVSNRSDVTAAQKLSYLKSSLRGEPFGLIGYLDTTDGNYAEAWKILNTRYENKREIIRSHTYKLLDLKPVKSESASCLQHLVDECTKCLKSLSVMGCPTDKWNDLTVAILERKLDSATRREWAKTQTGTNPSKFEDLQQFLSSHIRGLQAAGSVGGGHSSERRGDRNVKVHHANAEAGDCGVCKGNHQISDCKEFLKASDKNGLVRTARLCFNCLRADHMIKDCPSKRKCKKCGAKHHSLLHEDKKNGTATEKVQGNHVALEQEAAKGLLMTAVVNVKDRHGKSQQCRVFIDNGSTGDFISERCVSRLGLLREKSCVSVEGFGGSKSGKSNGMVRTTLANGTSGKTLDVDLHIMNKLTGMMPAIKCRNGEWRHLTGLTLADPQWHQPGPIDILLGMRYFSRLMLHQRIVGPDDDAPVAWETIFGWVVAGACPVERNVPLRTYHVKIDPLEAQLRKFWEVEEPPKKRILTADEKKCEEHFKSTYTRDENGRFIAGVPFDQSKRNTLGRSRDIAYKRLLQVERRLRRYPHLREQYVEFMKEYEAMGHMTMLTEGQAGEVLGETNYLCHHFVQNDSSSTTKLRVVFDGSAATSAGVPFNGTMPVGATLQDDLYDLLLRFRVHAVVLKADIAKMFRQFLLRDEDAKYHRILWRESPDLPVREYQLNTITYGTAYATNLATRCIQQLGEDCSTQFPEASRVLLNDAYVDDILTGTSTPKDAVQLHQDLMNAVRTAGLELRKWTSNDATVMATIPEALRETDQLVFEDCNDVKALGVQWHPPTDMFKFKAITFEEGKLTKRLLLSELARVFDPLGLISCVTLRGKLLLQELWKLPVGWDDEVPTSVKERWDEYKTDLLHLERLSIPRRITANGTERIELHGFADSSELGFGAIIYLRSIFPNGTVEVRLVTSKTRVTPVKQISLPRLELCAAVLLAELVVHVMECLKLDVEVFLWSDSTITLTWIAAPPRRWKTFIANRVALIQELTQIQWWRHVPGVENPADLASRGCAVRELCNSQFWWKGPAWLAQPVLPEFPIEDSVVGDLEEKAATVTVNQVNINAISLLERYSDLAILKRHTAWYIRLLLFRVEKKCATGPLLASELQTALHCWVRMVQQQHFSEDYARLKTGRTVLPKSQLKSLFPFIDRHGIIRVSGRLRNANPAEERQHQIILPGDSHLTWLLINQQHTVNFHSGFQLTWAALNKEFWILRGRDRVRHFVRKCVRCRRFRAKVAQQLMGDLPGPRVTPSRPLLHTGVDYAGHYTLKDVVGRVPKTYKGYMCLFVCMATKAIHLEPVSSLTTEAFLAALRRFVARRGLCAHIYSDNGTNFVGADKELRMFVASSAVREAMTRELGDRGITWHFNPPVAPHRGGLWESGVKSAKHHLRRSLQTARMTFEQFGTLLCEVEAVLNSRPLYQMSTDPGDLQPLTPGHFLVGEPLIAVPDASWLNRSPTGLSQFQRIQQQYQLFWQRWSSEYLNTLQQRNKWMWDEKNVKVGDLVLLVEETAPGSWKMGRIHAVRTGPDGRVRVVTVKTATSTFDRAIAKLVPLLNVDSTNKSKSEV